MMKGGPHRKEGRIKCKTLRGVRVQLVGLRKAVRKQQVACGQHAALPSAARKARQLAHVRAQGAEVLLQRMMSD